VGFVEVLLKCGGINVNLQNKLGNTALISTSIHGHSDIVKALLRCGNIDVNLSNIFGDTALIRARANGYIEIVKYLKDFEKKSVTGVDEVIMQSTAKLLHAMTDSSYGPVEIAP
jgi:ankyrin repeat protein